MTSSTPFAIVVALLLAACDRSSGDRRAPDVDASATPPASESASSLASPPDPEPAASADAAPREHEAPGGRVPPAAEARRASLRRLADERALIPHEAQLREHFGGTLPSPLEVQITPLPGERSAVLAYDEPRHRNPFLLALGPRGDLLWTKDRPLAGTRQVVTEMAVTSGPHGEVALVWCDIPTQIVGLRKWAADGMVLADFEVMEVDLCEALSGLYWPHHGWVAVASQHGAARAQLLDERGARAWGAKGGELPWTARPSSPASIAVDSDASVMVFQIGDLARAEGVSPNRVLAMRYDPQGAQLWERAIDLGPAPAGAPSTRIALTRLEAGQVRVALGARGTAVVTSAGSIVGAR